MYRASDLSQMSMAVLFSSSCHYRVRRRHVKVPVKTTPIKPMIAIIDLGNRCCNRTRTVVSHHHRQRSRTLSITVDHVHAAVTTPVIFFNRIS
jgi:hypothetical protein